MMGYRLASTTRMNHLSHQVLDVIDDLCSSALMLLQIGPPRHKSSHTRLHSRCIDFTFIPSARRSLSWKYASAQRPECARVYSEGDK